MTKILITGCSSGIGFNLAKHASAHGFEVVATMRNATTRNADNAAKLKAECEAGPGTLHVVELDVTSDDSVAEAAARTHELVGTLDAIVHNAGIGHLGTLEAFSVEQIQQVFDVNVFGPHRLNRALLPSMRARGQGLVVFISSMIGRIMLPYFGAYGPSKFALEALAENYRNELRLFGVDVTIVQAGGFDTNFMANAQTPADAGTVASYGEHGQRAAQFWAMAAAHMPPIPAPDMLSDVLVELIEAAPGTRPLRKVVDVLAGEAMEAMNMILMSVPLYLANMTRSPTLTSTLRNLPSLSSLPWPTATTLPSIGLSLAVSGM